MRRECEAFLRPAHEVSIADTNALRMAENWVSSHRLVQRDVDRKVDIGLDLALLLLGAVFSTSFTRAWGLPDFDFALTWPTLGEALGVGLALGILVVFGVIYARAGRSFSENLALMSASSREDPDGVVQSLPFSDPAFRRKFHADANAAATIATATSDQVQAMVHFTYGGRMPRGNETEGSSLLDVSFKFFQFGAGFVLGAVIAVITGSG